MIYFKTLFNKSHDAVAIVDADFNVLNINQSFHELFQYNLEEIENKNLTEVLTNQNPEARIEEYKKSIRDGNCLSKELKRQRKDGTLVDVLLMVIPIKGEGEKTSIYCMYTDISDVKNDRQMISDLTYKDNLTGLFNKDFFLENLRNELLKKIDSKNNLSKLAVLVINLNEFKELNDALGYGIGDLMFKEFSSRLKKCVGKNDVIARLNKDHLVIMLPNLMSASELNKLTHSIINTVDQVFYIEDQELFASTNIGISIYPDDGDQSTTLMRKKAEIALDKSKERKQNTFITFKKSFDKEIQEAFWIKRDLEKAIANNELFLNYQPICDLNINQTIGVEALLRWNHPEHGVISPMKFIPVAEKSRAILNIGEWVLLESCKQNKKWQDQGLRHIEISVNVSVVQLEEGNFIEIVKKVLSETGLAPEYLQLEVTETVLTRDYESIKKTIDDIANLGVKFSIDDFGTGYSSLGQLSELNIHNLKVDKSFIDDVDSNPSKAKIVKAIIILAESLGISLIAEGVETARELFFLKENKCQLVQGYIFSKPLAPESVSRILKS